MLLEQFAHGEDCIIVFSIMIPYDFFLVFLEQFAFGKDFITFITRVSCYHRIGNMTFLKMSIKLALCFKHFITLLAGRVQL